MTSAVLAIDVGGSSIKAAVVDVNGAVTRRCDVPTPVAEGPDAVVAALRAVAAELDGPGVEAAGVVVPGQVDLAGGVARYSVNLGWRDVPLRELLQDDLDRPVVIDHDVRAAGRAERQLGRAAGVSDCIIVVLGTGIAAVLVSGGTPVGGATWLAGEIGHVPVYPDGEACPCGQRGCTEVYASAAGIARRYRAAAGRALTTPEIVAARVDDPIATRVWAEAADALGLALASYTMLLDPALVVLGGGLAGAGEALRAPVAAALGARLTWRPAPALEMSDLGGRAGQLGAALLAWQAAGRDVGAAWRSCS